MIRAWVELRGAVSALVLLGIVARLLMPLTTTARIERATFDRLLAGVMCLPSGQPAPIGQDAPNPAKVGHCPLCRLPESTHHPGPAPVAQPVPRWSSAPVAIAARSVVSLRPPPRGPPPARAPPAFQTLG